MTPTCPFIDTAPLLARGSRIAMRLLALLLSAGCAFSAAAQDKTETAATDPPASTAGTEAASANTLFSPEGWDLSLSPYTYHFHPSDEHEHVYSIGLIKRLEKHWIVGASLFSNSFGQPSGYLFVGQRFDNLPGFDKWYLQWNAGVLYGYVGEYKDKVPFNYKGFSPGFVPSIGYRFTDRIYGELDLLGNSALMFTLIFPIPKGGF